MSDYAFYAITLGSERFFFYDKWGHPGVPHLLLSGPSQATYSIERRTETSQFNGNCEAFIHLNVSTKRAEWFASVAMNSDPQLRRTFERILIPIWEGWSIAYNPEGIDVLAGWMGIPEGSPWPRSNSWGSDWGSTSILNVDPNYKFKNVIWGETIISWVDELGNVADSGQPGHAIGYLRRGPALIEHLRKCRNGILSRGAPKSGAWLDLRTKKLVCTDSLLFRKSELKPIASAWPTWQVFGQADGFAGQAILSGRNEPDGSRSPVELAQVMAEELFDAGVTSVSIGDQEFEEVESLKVGILKRITATAKLEIPIKLVGL